MDIKIIYGRKSDIMRVDHVRTDEQFSSFRINRVQTNRPVKRCAPTAISVLFMSWLVVVGAGSSGEEVVGERGTSFFCAFITAVWIGLEGWLFGGFIFYGPPPMRRSPTFFCLCLRHCLSRDLCLALAA